MTYADKRSRHGKTYGVENDRVITLAEFATIINEAFGLLGDDIVADATPYVWWDRHLHAGEPGTTRGTLAAGFPDPVTFIGGVRRTRNRRPLFNAAEVLVWYRKWKRIPVDAKHAADLKKWPARSARKGETGEPDGE